VQKIETPLCAAVKCKVFPVDAVKVYKGCGSIEPLLLNLGTKFGGGRDQPDAPAALAP